MNDYDLAIQHNEAVALACEHIGVIRTKTDGYFDGTQGKRLVKIIPFNHPLSPADLEQLKQELKARENEERDILLVCLGKELACELEKKTDLVTGSYTFPAPADNTTVAVKIIDMLGEEVLVVAEV